MPPGRQGLASRRPGHRLVKHLENGLSIALLTALAAVPLTEFAGRSFAQHGLPGAIPLGQHLTLWITFAGAALAARDDRMLALSFAELVPERHRAWMRLCAGSLAAIICALLAVAGRALVEVERAAGSQVAFGLPVWLAVWILPAGFALIAVRLILRASDGAWGRAIASLCVVAALLIELPSELQGQGLASLAFAVIVAALVIGMPIFAGIGGLALCLVWDSGFPVASVPAEAYRLAASPMLPAIPLFTLAGYLLAESGSSRRLFRLLTAAFGWLPGGVAIATVVILAAFTPFTGASGVTILSLGGLLLPGLMQAGYPERFSLGLVTAAGSIGLLLPPSLPVILYGVSANVSVLDMFVGGLVPGLLLVTLAAAWGVREGLRVGAPRPRFQLRELRSAAWECRWELLLPLVVLGAYFGGVATLVEASAFSVLGALLITRAAHRELSLVHDIPRLAVESATLVGGFLIILCMALALTNYLILDEIPMKALELTQSWIDSPLVFLLFLNVLLILVGGLMDIYSAIFVIVPLIAPMAAAYGIHPVHLGTIFLANLVLGYLTPPMGENLFLAAYRFGRPLPELFRAALPFWVLLLAGVLLITYAPVLTMGLVGWYAD